MSTWDEQQVYILNTLLVIKEKLVQIENRIEDKAGTIYKKIDVIADKCEERALQASKSISDLEHQRILPIEIKVAAAEGSKGAFATAFSTVLSIIAIVIAWFTAK